MRVGFSLAPLQDALIVVEVSRWNAVAKWNAAVESGRVAAATQAKAAGSHRGQVSRDSQSLPGRSLAAATLPITGDYHTWPDWPLWHAVGLCEQRGDGPDGIAWHGSPAGGTADSGYPGGLGMSRDFWATFAPIAGVATTNGALASPAEQIRVGRAGSHNGTRMGGWSSWPGCIKRNDG